MAEEQWMPPSAEPIEDNWKPPSAELHPESHPVHSWLDSLSEGVRNVIKDHPVIQRILSGNQPGDNEAERTGAMNSFSGMLPAGMRPTPQQTHEAINAPIQGPGMGVDTRKFTDPVANWMTTPKLGESPGWATAKGAVAGGIQGFGDLIGQGLDPRAVGTKPNMELIAEDVSPFKANIDPNAQPRQPQRALPEAPISAIKPPTMIGGPSVLENPNAPGQVAPAQGLRPDVAAHMAGMGEGQPVQSGIGTGVNPAEVAEQNRLASLQYGPEAQYPGTRLNLPDQPAMQQPPVSGDTGLGFNPQTDPTQSLGYPLDVVPNQLRPRTIQSQMMRAAPGEFQAGSAPEASSDIGFTSGGIENPAVPPQPRQESFSGMGDARPGEPQLPSAPPRPSFSVRGVPEELTPAEPPRPPLDIVNAVPRQPKTVADVGKIPAGQAEAKDGLSGFGANYSSPQNLAKEFPELKGVVEPILKANDEKFKWLATTQRELAQYSQGLSKADAKILGMLLDGQEIAGASPDLIQRATKVRQIMDGIHSMFPEGATAAGKDVGYLENYFTHIQRQPDDIRSAIKSIFSRTFGENATLTQRLKGFAEDVTPGVFKRENLGEADGRTPSMYGKNMGDPKSQFVEPRNDVIKDIEYNYNKVMPAYTESAAKVIFDKPAVDAAKAALAKLPEGSIMKEWATGYIKNYTGYDSEPQLHAAWNKVANTIGTMSARAVVNMNPGLHMLHLGQVPANLWPELGTKYTLKGMKELATNIQGNYQEMARLGLLQGMIKPFKFQTGMERADSIMYGMSYVESLVRGIGYNGFKAKFMDMGMSEAEASLKALQETKNAVMTVDPARSMRGFTPEANWFGSESGRVTNQFKQIPSKIVEQIVNNTKAAKQDPSKFTRNVIGAGLAFAGTAGGLHTFHVNPKYLATAGGWGVLGSAVTKAYNHMAAGDAMGAMTDVADYITPGLAQTKKMLKFVSGSE